MGECWLQFWPDAAERYCPELFAQWRAAAGELQSRPPRIGRLTRWNYLGRLIRREIEELPHLRAPLLQAERETRDALLTALVRKLRNRELVATGIRISANLPAREEIADWEAFRRLLSDDRVEFGLGGAMVVISSVQVRVSSTAAAAQPERRDSKPSMAAIRDVLRDIYSNDAPNVGDATREVQRRLPGASRLMIGPLLKEPEFKNRRRPRGRPRR